MKLILTCITWIFLLPLFAQPAPATIVVDGQARDVFTPDKAVISLEIIAQAKSTKEATELIRKNTEQVIAVIKKHKVPDSSYYFSGSQVSKVWQQEKNKPDLYQASHRLQVELPADALSVSILMEEIQQKTNVQSYVNFSFYSKTEDSIREKLIVKALADAKRKAALIAAEFNIQLDPQTGVSIVYTSQANAYTPMLRSSYTENKAMLSDDVSGGVNLSIQPQPFEETVQVTFSIK